MQRCYIPEPIKQIENNLFCYPVEFSVEFLLGPTCVYHNITSYVLQDLMFCVCKLA